MRKKLHPYRDRAALLSRTLLWFFVWMVLISVSVGCAASPQRGGSSHPFHTKMLVVPNVENVAVFGLGVKVESALPGVKFLDFIHSQCVVKRNWPNPPFVSRHKAIGTVDSYIGGGLGVWRIAGEATTKYLHIDSVVYLRSWCRAVILGLSRNFNTTPDLNLAGGLGVQRCGYYPAKPYPWALGVGQFTFCGSGHITGRTSLPEGQPSVDDYRAHRDYLDNKRLSLVGCIFLLGGFIVLYKTWWKLSFDFTSHVNISTYLAFILVSCVLIWIGQWLLLCGFGLAPPEAFEHDLSPSSANRYESLSDDVHECKSAQAGLSMWNLAISNSTPLRAVCGFVNTFSLGIISPITKSRPMLSKLVSVFKLPIDRDICFAVDQPFYVFGRNGNIHGIGIEVLDIPTLIAGTRENNAFHDAGVWLVFCEQRLLVSAGNLKRPAADDPRSHAFAYVPYNYLHIIRDSISSLFQASRHFEPSSLLDLKVMAQVAPLEVSNASISDASPYSEYAEKSFPWLPLFPPWIGFALCLFGFAGIAWGWRNDRRLPWSFLGFIGGVILWSFGLFIVLPWSVS